MPTGNGKIASLPAKIREDLNNRIDDGEPGNKIVEWLNSNLQVMEVLIERFDACPITEQNLSEWRKRGYQQWLAYRMVTDELGGLSENADAIGQTGISGEKLLLVLTAAYAVMIQNWEIIPKDELTYKMAVFRNLTNGVLAVRRGELQAIRIEIARERLEMLREKRLYKPASSRSNGGASASREAQSAASVSRRSGTSGIPTTAASESDASIACQNPAPPSPSVAKPAPAPRSGAGVPPSSNHVRPTQPAHAEEPANLKNAADYFDPLGSNPARTSKLAA